MSLNVTEMSQVRNITRCNGHVTECNGCHQDITRMSQKITPSQLDLRVNMLTAGS